VPIPGASAVLAALVGSGFVAPRWSFEGFLPRRGGERRARLARIAADDRATVLFEAPGRTVATLLDHAAACGGERPAAVARELTKVHEEFWHGTLAEVARRATDHGVRGEVTIVIGPAPARIDGPSVPLEEARRRVEQRVAGGASRSAAARDVARETGHDRRGLYREAARRS
jgi:16S rRNA (cytidine1402-2'-O)-methyltransferase